MSATDDAGRPWWASDGQGLGDEDPVESHRRARAAGSSGDGARTRDHGAGAEDGEAREGERDRGSGGGDGPGDHPWWADAAELLARVAREAGRAAGAGNGRAGAVGRDHVHTGSVDACQICPVCTGIRLLGEVRPEVVSHVTEAARHLTLALKAVVDAQAEAMGADDGLQRIDLDDE